MIQRVLITQIEKRKAGYIKRRTLERALWLLAFTTTKNCLSDEVSTPLIVVILLEISREIHLLFLLLLPFLILTSFTVAECFHL